MTSDLRAVALRRELDAIEPVDETERTDRDATCSLLQRCEAPFDEAAQPDHITASAFVVSALGVVLHRHRLLGIWVQPGGHIDTGESPHHAAVREVREETGIVSTHFAPPVLVHVNVHDGPRGHRHFDCRWLLEARGTQLSPGATESPEVGWYLPEAALERCEPGLRVGLAKAIGAARGLGLAAVASWPT